jgi:hypothetical protein
VQSNPITAVSGGQARQQGETEGWVVRLSPDVLRRTEGLSLNAMRLVIALEQFSRSRPSCFPSNRKLAVEVGCTPRRVRSGLAELEAAGWIRRVIDPAMRDRGEIVMLRRLDSGQPIGGNAPREGVGRKRPGGRTTSSQGGRTEASPRIKTQDEVGHSEEAARIHFAHARQCSGVPERSAHSAGQSAPARTSSRKEPKMTAREMDVAILEYAAMAGSMPDRSPWTEPDVEPFQAPAEKPQKPAGVPVIRDGMKAPFAIGERVRHWNAYWPMKKREAAPPGVIVDIQNLPSDSRCPARFKYTIARDDGMTVVAWIGGHPGEHPRGEHLEPAS